ncbi:MAG TPA: SusC/RagA family TonB-linked outer membrane protein, partial [Cytophagales bacterium]|nr:SusC/RagA family TonB-linked outer membrane protein [Cytophagales bacterium]
INLNISSLDRDYNNGGRIAEAITRRPTDPIYTDNPLFTDVGSYFIDPNSFSYINPVARTEEIIDGDLTNNIFTSLRLEYEIFDGLTATAFGSWRKTNREYQSYVSPRTTREDARNLGETESVNDINQLPDGIATVANDVSDEKLYNLILNYKKDFGDHSIDVLGVNEWQKQVYNGGSSTVRGFIVDDPSNIYAMQSADATLYRQGDISSYKNDRTLASFLGRVNYSYMGKYYASASIRRDGSSVFGANNKWANFYAGSLAWRISDEGFMDAVDVIDNLKLRVGYGETGNQQGLGALNSVRLANNDGTTYFGGTVIPNYSITQNENADLRWEVKKMFNAGLDFGFIKGKLTGAIDAFTGVTSDLLFDYEVPQPPYPFGTIKANVGEVLNQGLELSLNYITVDQGDWYVTLGGNVSMNRTEVQELNGSLNGVPLETDYVVWGSGGTTGVASTNNAISHLIIGQPLGSFYLFKHAGVDSNGNQIIDDLDGDGSVEDGNRENDDRYLAGQALPKVTWAFTPTASYKNFDLSVLVRGAHGHQIYNARRATLSALGTLGQSNVLNSALETGVNNITYASDLWLEKGDYVRLENITLGYNFNTTSWSFVESLRLSFTANNLFVITEYTGIDPEISTSGGSGFGIDYGIYPRTRNFAVGLNATF